MSREKLAGWIIIAAGVVVLVVSVFADQLGFGETEAGGFGFRQILGSLAGLVIVAVGALFAFRSPTDSD